MYERGFKRPGSKKKSNGKKYSPEALLPSAKVEPQALSFVSKALDIDPSFLRTFMRALVLNKVVQPLKHFVLCTKHLGLAFLMKEQAGHKRGLSLHQ